MFCNAGRSAGADEICDIGGLLIDDLDGGSIFHVISWFSHMAHRPSRSTCAGETIASGEGIDVRTTITLIYSQLLCMRVDLVIVVDSNDLYTTLITQ